MTCKACADLAALKLRGREAEINFALSRYEHQMTLYPQVRLVHQLLLLQLQACTRPHAVPCSTPTHR